MNISRLNPIGYQATTEKGNAYKKSNIAKSTLLGYGITMAAARNLSKNPFLNSMSEKAFIQRLGIKNNKIVTALTIGVVAIGVGIDFWVGSLIDKAINKKRAAKADKL